MREQRHQFQRLSLCSFFDKDVTGFDHRAAVKFLVRSKDDTLTPCGKSGTRVNAGVQLKILISNRVGIATRGEDVSTVWIAPGNRRGLNIDIRKEGIERTTERRTKHRNETDKRSGGW